MNLTKEERNVVVSILKRHLPSDVEVFFFGSRMDNTTTPQSDLDILLKGKTPIDLGIVSLMKEGFEESDLPFKVDVLDYHRLSKRMFENISKGLVKII